MAWIGINENLKNEEPNTVIYIADTHESDREKIISSDDRNTIESQNHSKLLF